MLVHYYVIGYADVLVKGVRYISSFNIDTPREPVGVRP